jgi:hypothetical protein
VQYLDVCSHHVQCQADPTHQIPQEARVPMPPLKKLRGTKLDAQEKWARRMIPKLFYAWAEAQVAKLDGWSVRVYAMNSCSICHAQTDRCLAQLWHIACC